MVKVDVASVAHRIEHRSPLLDHVPMEWADGIPKRTKMVRGLTCEIRFRQLGSSIAVKHAGDKGLRRTRSAARYGRREDIGLLDTKEV